MMFLFVKEILKFKDFSAGCVYVCLTKYVFEYVLKSMDKNFWKKYLFI